MEISILLSSNFRKSVKFTRGSEREGQISMPKLIAQEELRVLICDQFIRDTAICESVGSCLIQFVENFRSLVWKS